MERDTTTKVKKVKLSLAGLDGNAFVLMGMFRKQARKEGWNEDEIKEVLDKCTSAGSYDQLVSILENHTK